MRTICTDILHRVYRWSEVQVSERHFKQSTKKRGGGGGFDTAGFLNTRQNSTTTVVYNLATQLVWLPINALMKIALTGQGEMNCTGIIKFPARPSSST